MRGGVPVLKRATLSPTGHYAMYQEGGNWWSVDLSTGARSNLTGKIKSVFVNMEDDHPVHERRPYGVGGWTTGDRSVILYDRYDLWQVAPDGSNPVRLTRGREDSTVYRIEWLDTESRTIDPAKPLMLATTGDWNKKSGYARLTIGQPAQRLLWVDKSISRLTQARNAANVYAYVAQSAAESPNLFVTSGLLSNAQPVSHTNAFLADHAWGKQELMAYTNSRGDKLQMMLTYPADYQPGKQYPMVVYYYEKLSQGFHVYNEPNLTRYSNPSVFTSRGYAFLMPDIVYHVNDPGRSATWCIVPAVKAAIATGIVDPERVGDGPLGVPRLPGHLPAAAERVTRIGRQFGAEPGARGNDNLRTLARVDP